MEPTRTRAKWSLKLGLVVAVAAAVALTASAGATQAGSSTNKGPKWIDAAAFDTSKPLRDLVKNQKPSTKVFPAPTGNDTDSELSVEPSKSARLASGAGTSAAVSGQTTQAQATAAIPGANFEGLSNTGQLQHLRIPREPAGPGRRRGPEPLRRDDQPRLRRLLEDRDAPSRAGRHRHALGGLPDRGLHGSLGRPDRRVRPGRRPLAPDPVHHALGPSTYECVAISTDGRPDRRLLPLRVLNRSQLPGLPEARRLEGLVHPHDARVRPDRRVYGIGVYAPRAEQDDRRPSEGAGRRLLPRRDERCPTSCRSSATACFRRTWTESRSRRERARADRRDAGRRRWIRGDVRRRSTSGTSTSSGRSTPDASLDARDAAAGRAVRLDLPVRADVP